MLYVHRVGKKNLLTVIGDYVTSSLPCPWWAYSDWIVLLNTITFLQGILLLISSWIPQHFLKICLTLLVFARFLSRKWKWDILFPMNKCNLTLVQHRLGLNIPFSSTWRSYKQWNNKNLSLWCLWIRNWKILDN